MATWFIALANLAILAAVVSVGFAYRWIGPGFCLGILVGVGIVHVHYRMKFGRWM